ncbi:VWA domain-containing protein [Sporosarcina luteola]|uniref:VWA domain-containing protein n=1 Tax=Sporosarcina luteola TaxID=582850 RepID=UPI0020420100|nr:VWA domain-containing protein [Sporosarcina luteola]MCM3743523.1 VWA domain-containing protein [Sporosarcina luteola]
MNSRNRRTEIRSVLNTDAFDKRRFRDIFDMSSGLQKVRAEGVLPMFDSLLADIWASLYKMKPEIIEEDLESVLKVNKSLMERIMADENFDTFRTTTRLDDLSSAIGTVKFGEKMNQWLVDQKNQAEELKEQMQEILAVQRQLQRQEWHDETGNGSRAIEEKITELMDRFDEKLKQKLESNSNSFSQALVQALHETKQVKEGLKSLFGGTRAGSGDAELKKVPLRDQLSLAEKIASDKKMKEIADWAGRFKQAARKKQKAEYNDAMERSGVTIGGDIERLLPMELGFYMHPITRNDFLRRFAEGQTMLYEQEGKEVLGKGPIILCLDQSGSMQHLDSQSKGFTLALISIARKQRRDFCLILFSTRLQVFTYEKGKLKISDMVNLAQTFLSGGTDFSLPLGKSLSVINESRFKKADVVFVTDGEDSIKDSFLEEFNKKKKEKAFNVLSFIIGNSTNTVEQFSDKVVMVKDFEDEGSYAAFEI